MNELLWILLALPLAGALALLLLPPATGDRIAAPLGAVVSGLALADALAILVAFDYDAAGDIQMETEATWVSSIDVGFHLGIDGISLPLVVLTALLSFLGLAASVRYIPKPGRPRAFVGLVLLLEVGMLGTFLALDLMLFFVAFEIVLLPMYFLIAVWGGEGKVAAATKFILYTLLGSALMLLGFLLIGWKAGTFDLVALADAQGAGLSHTVQVVAFLAIGIGFAVKTPMWPLHTWLPDAHTAAPTVGSVLLAGVLLKMGTYGFVRIGLPVVPEGAETLAPYLGAFAVVGILYGSLACLAQRDLKRLIAFSSVGHMGFVLLGVSTLTAPGVNGALYANVAHGLITGLLFFLVGAIKDREGTSDIDAIGGSLYARTPRLASLLTFAAVASLGLPGLAGFWGEMLAMFGAFEPADGLDRSYFLVLMAFAGLGTVLTAAYLLRMVRRVNQGPAGVPRVGSGAPAFALSVWTPLVVLIVVLGLWPKALLDVTDPAVRLLLGGG